MEEEHVNLTSGLSQSKAQSTIGTTLKRIEHSAYGRHRKAQHKQYAEASPSKRFAGCIKAPMTHYEASTAYWTMWLPSITFGFSSTTMNHNNSTQSK
jgi:hypothetical protein